MKTNSHATKGNLVLLKCWDSKTPEKETSSTTLEFFQVCSTNKQAHKCYSHFPYCSTSYLWKYLSCLDRKHTPVKYLIRKLNGCSLNTYIFLYGWSRKNVHTINQLLKEKVTQKWISLQSLQRLPDSKLKYFMFWEPFIPPQHVSKNNLSAGLERQEGVTRGG